VVPPISEEQIVRTKLVAVLTVLAAIRPAAAQQAAPDPAAGLELASQLCTACHIVGTERVGSDAAPPFRAIARDAEITVTELHGWIGPRHPRLPNLALSPKQAADINAYLDTLRDGDVEAAPGTATEEPPPAIEEAPPERFGEPIEPSD
jgi:mono/diheme cytochrome c family protein